MLAPTGLQLGNLSLPETCDVTPMPQAEDGLPPFQTSETTMAGLCLLAFTPTRYTLLQVQPLSPTHHITWSHPCSCSHSWLRNQYGSLVFPAPKSHRQYHEARASCILEWCLAI